MAQLEVLDWNKKKVGTVDWPEAMSVEIRKDILHTVVKWQLAKRRSGTHSVKTRSMVRGTGAKPYKQKGTGNARRGNVRTPLTRGGAVTHGPSPRDYDYALPKKIKQAGLKNALAYLQQEGRLFVVDQIDTTGKTKELNQKLQKFGVKKAVLIDEKENETAMRACMNLPKFVYGAVDAVNVYDLLKYDSVILTKSSIPKILSRCGV